MELCFQAGISLEALAMAADLDHVAIREDPSHHWAALSLAIINYGQAPHITFSQSFGRRISEHSAELMPVCRLKDI